MIWRRSYRHVEEFTTEGNASNQLVAGGSNNIRAAQRPPLNDEVGHLPVIHEHDLFERIQDRLGNVVYIAWRALKKMRHRNGDFAED